MYPTSVSKRPQKLHNTASAIYVVTQEDIRRSGAVNIPEVLRLVPGVWVGKIDQNQYAISIRGFNSEFRSKKLLVFIDGRSIYSPLSSGVIWAAQDVMLEDIDRIEVIRGPGSALYGANAFSGIVNIITKAPQDMAGQFGKEAMGSQNLVNFHIRHGRELSNRTAFSISAGFDNLDREEERYEGLSSTSFDSLLDNFNNRMKGSI